MFAIGLNSRDHIAETGQAPPESLSVFTKFATSLTGPNTVLALPAGNAGWEVELVAIIGKRAGNVAEADAWNHVAGLTAGRDYSERVVQTAGSAPQFSLGKSFPGFGPTGPWLVTPDAFADPDDLALECTVNGQSMQKSPHVPADLLRRVPGQLPVGRHRPAARGHHLHRHPGRRRDSSHAAALPASRR